jgi:hypothetical protein
MKITVAWLAVQQIIFSTVILGSPEPILLELKRIRLNKFQLLANAVKWFVISATAGAKIGLIRGIPKEIAN